MYEQWYIYQVIFLKCTKISHFWTHLNSLKNLQKIQDVSFRTVLIPLKFLSFADGVVLIDPDYIKDRKVFGNVVAAFKYGREDLDVLGLTFRKDLYLAAKQIYPVIQDSEPRELTRLQERLIKKLGSCAYPFYFELPPHCPASVTLQPAPGDTGKPCGVDYELKAFVGEAQDDKPHKRFVICVKANVSIFRFLRFNYSLLRNLTQRACNSIKRKK